MQAKTQNDVFDYCDYYFSPNKLGKSEEIINTTNDIYKGIIRKNYPFFISYNYGKEFKNEILYI